jgi:hypothetical protein
MPFPAVLDASLLNPLLALVLCAALLWVGSAVAWEASAPGALRTGSLDFVAVVLLAAGLWWPAHAASAFQTTGSGITLALMVLLGVVTASMARLGVLAPWHHPQQLLGSGGVLLSSLLFVSLLHALPGAGLPWTPLTLMVSALVLTVALRGLHRPLRNTRLHVALRSACALLAAALLTAVTWRDSAKRNACRPRRARTSTCLRPCPTAARSKRGWPWPWRAATVKGGGWR